MVKIIPIILLHKNFGNYGIVYNFEPKLEGKGKTSFYLKPLGGVYAGAMAVKVGENGEYKMISTPDDLPFFGHEKDINYYAYLGTYNNSDKLSFYIHHQEHQIY